MSTTASSRTLTRTKAKRELELDEGAKRRLEEQLRLKEAELRDKTSIASKLDNDLVTLKTENNTLKQNMKSLEDSIQTLLIDLEGKTTITKFVNCITLSDCNETILADNITSHMISFGAALITQNTLALTSLMQSTICCRT